MGMHTTKVAVGEGKFALEAQLTVTPRGMAVYACSPEFAHLGATAQAIPRPEPGRTATVSILAVPCHRDEIPAHDIAAALATRFGVPVVASTGFHVEQASGGDLQRVLDTTKELIAAKKSVEEIRDFIGADSLAFLSLDGLVESIGLGADAPYGGLCVAYFNGDYPTALDDYESDFLKSLTPEDRVRLPEFALYKSKYEGNEYTTTSSQEEH